jgi:DsbC/DsbD-like thiol-disulfide interchange protein
MNRRMFATCMATLLVTQRAWAATPRYEARLIAGAFDGARWTAGVDIVMEPGWKTYWRMPGDAGVPPDFDWSESGNLAEAVVSYPAPRRFHDAAGETVGYTDAVLFPLSVTPEDAAQPVELKLNLFFAVCKDICIPAKAKPGLRLDGASDAEGIARIAAAEATVPRRGDAVAAVTIGTIDGLPALDVRLASPAPADLDIFVEGGGLAYFRAPRPQGDGRYLLPFDGLKNASDLKGKTLTLTLVGEGLALEQRVTVG